MQGVFWDIIRAENYTNHLVAADLKKDRTIENARFQQQIFAIHRVSKKDFYKSYSYYKANPVLMKTLLDSMINKASRGKIFIMNPATGTDK